MNNRKRTPNPYASYDIATRLAGHPGIYTARDVATLGGYDITSSLGVLQRLAIADLARQVDDGSRDRRTPQKFEVFDYTAETVVRKLNLRVRTIPVPPPAPAEVNGHSPVTREELREELASLLEQMKAVFG